ncbi:unnamed protein product [Linum trigynum]|uniref:Uncharacterized protein n=1 Tax=Linum trigynum TaxID=586398 RepID=A0AAV2EE68_9ROSI
MVDSASTKLTTLQLKLTWMLQALSGSSSRNGRDPAGSITSCGWSYLIESSPTRKEPRGKSQQAACATTTKTKRKVCNIFSEAARRPKKYGTK